MEKKKLAKRKIDSNQDTQDLRFMLIPKRQAAVKAHQVLIYLLNHFHLNFFIVYFILFLIILQVFF
jgi:hypothetical protein